MELSDPSGWETRFDWTLTALMLAAYAMAIYVSGLSPAGRSQLWAAIIAGTYIVIMQVLPRRLREQRLVGEILAVTGVASIVTALALTDGNNGGYALLLAAPVFFASAFMGLRIGMETALLACAGLVGVRMANDGLTIDQVSVIVLYLLIGFTFSQARRLLVIERSLADRLRAASELNAARLTRLEEAHSLLMSLSDVAGTAELSRRGVGELALHDLAERFPIVAGEVTTEPGNEGVATMGLAPDGPADVELPVETADHRLGTIRLWLAPDAYIDRNQPDLVAAVAAVALAFDNIQLLRTVARRAVQDERSRVARDLHDHIGPELASLGLTLDLLVHQPPEAEVTPQLAKLRGSVMELVERVRGTVADLRLADTTSVMDHIHRIALERRPDQARVVVGVDERHVLAGAVATELGAVIGEAVRNVDRHADATLVHIDGIIDEHGGRIIVTDDGAGFDPDGAYPGHFGLLGMRERVAAIGGRLDMMSNAEKGTTIAVVWGDRAGKVTRP